MLTHFQSKGLALARGSIVLIMPAVHTILLYSTDQVKAGSLGIIFGFLAEQPGAQLFMLQMGLFIGIGREKAFKKAFKRFIQLLIAGYLLNAFRLVLTYYLGGLPDRFLIDYQITDSAYAPLQLLAIIDILQFAAVAYLCCHLIQNNIKSIWVKAVLLLLALCITPFTWNIYTAHKLPDLLLMFLTGIPPKAFFPFFPWICYPLAGLIIAQIIKKPSCHINTTNSLIFSLFVVAIGATIRLTEPIEWNSNFYRLAIGGTLQHIGIAMVWMIAFIFISEKLLHNKLFSFLEWLSRNITSIYILQWMLIMWLLPLAGYHSLNLTHSLTAILITSAISFGLPFWWQQHRQNKERLATAT